MRTLTQGQKFFLLFALLLAPGLILIFLSKADHKFKTLPYFGEKVAMTDNDETDTLYHQIESYSFVNQFGTTMDLKEFDGNILVANFFTTSCATICPIMTKQMARLQWMLEDPAYDDVMLLSHSLDAQNDTPDRLLEYGEEEEADFDKWTFAVASRTPFLGKVTDDYLLEIRSEEGALYSKKFILVDRNQHIRGYFDGTSSKEVDDLVTAIKMLKKEEILKESEKIPS